MGEWSSGASYGLRLQLREVRRPYVLYVFALAGRLRTMSDYLASTVQPIVRTFC